MPSTSLRSTSLALASRSTLKEAASSLLSTAMALLTTGASLTPSMVTVALVVTRPPLPSLTWYS